MKNTNGGNPTEEIETNKDNNNNNNNIEENINVNDNENEIVDMKEIIKEWDKEYLAIEKISSSKEATTCTYDKGYHNQEVFSCLTCYNDLKKYGALCVGCSFSCHRGHDIISLYYKRNIKLSECKLIKEKDYSNSMNEYNHNYEERYCYCNEGENDSEMIQCFICEDWYHKSHLKLQGDNSTDNDEGELICNNCFTKNSFDFILDYPFEEGLILFPLLNSANNQQSDTETPRKAKRTLEEAFGSIDKGKQSAECNRIIALSSIKKNNKKIYDMIIKEKYDVIFSVKILESKICHCVNCTELYTKYHLPFTTKDFYVEWVKRIPFESKINKEIEEDSEENKNILEKGSNISRMMKSKLNELDVEKQVELSMINKEFYDQFKQYLLSIKPVDDKEIIVTNEHVQEFLKNFRKILDK